MCSQLLETVSLGELVTRKFFFDIACSLESPLASRWDIIILCQADGLGEELTDEDIEIEASDSSCHAILGGQCDH
jgi:hypothetical protein